MFCFSVGRSSLFLFWFAGEQSTDAGSIVETRAFQFFSLLLPSSVLTPAKLFSLSARQPRARNACTTNQPCARPSPRSPGAAAKRPTLIAQLRSPSPLLLHPRSRSSPSAWGASRSRNSQVNMMTASQDLNVALSGCSLNSQQAAAPGKAASAAEAAAALPPPPPPKWGETPKRGQQQQQQRLAPLAPPHYDEPSCDLPLSQLAPQSQIDAYMLG